MKLRFPIQVTPIQRDPMNYHGPYQTTLTNTVRVWRLVECRVPAWRLSLYGPLGQWWRFDIVFRGFRG